METWVDGKYKMHLESESDLTLTLSLILNLTNYFRFQYTFIPAMDRDKATATLDMCNELAVVSATNHYVNK